MSAYSPTPVIICDRCGAEIPSGAKFCSNCGQEVSREEPTFAPPPPASSESYWGSDTPTPSPVDLYTGPSDAGGGGIGKLFSAKGRIGRMEYFLTLLGIWAVLIVAWGIVIGADAPLLTILLGFTSLIASMVVAICAGIKRLHDIGQTGWLYLIYLIPFISFIFLLFLLLKGPDSTHNQYGFEGSGSLKG